MQWLVLLFLSIFALSGCYQISSSVVKMGLLSDSTEEFCLAREEKKFLGGKIGMM